MGSRYDQLKFLDIKPCVVSPSDIVYSALGHISLTEILYAGSRGLFSTTRGFWPGVTELDERYLLAIEKGHRIEG